MLRGESEYDGYNLDTFVHEDTLDVSRNRLNAGRASLQLGRDGSPWSAQAGVTLLGSTNRNLLDRLPINQTWGKRRMLDLQVQRSFSLGTAEHQLIVAAESEREGYRTRDFYYGGFSDQDRTRRHQALTGEWRMQLPGLVTDLALRRDIFGGFKDSTSVRASALVPLDGGWSVSAAYATGITQPTFVEQFGYFPGTFVGNDQLKPESSRGFEASLRYRSGKWTTALTAYRQRLRDEIVDVYDPLTGFDTSVNRAGRSSRSGLEAEAGVAVAPWLDLHLNYAYLRATQPPASGSGRMTEARRPRHSGALVADGEMGQWSYGGSVAFVGKRRDNQDNYPFAPVTLGTYWLADARIAFAVRPGVELFARGSNLFDAKYQDAAGYRTEGRGLFAGIRLADRRSSR
jgi:vitamin B12 transporter